MVPVKRASLCVRVSKLTGRQDSRHTDANSQWPHTCPPVVLDPALERDAEDDVQKPFPGHRKQLHHGHDGECVAEGMRVSEESYQATEQSEDDELEEIDIADARRKK